MIRARSETFIVKYLVGLVFAALCNEEGSRVRWKRKRADFGNCGKGKKNHAKKGGLFA